MEIHARGILFSWDVAAAVKEIPAAAYTRMKER
jgi:hypothetical protein